MEKTIKSHTSKEKWGVPSTQLLRTLSQPRQINGLATETLSRIASNSGGCLKRQKE